MDMYDQDLSSTGAKTVLVKNIGPQGCGPFWLSYFSHAPSDFDKYGCSISYNDAVKFYNTQLQEELALVRKQLLGTDIVYVNQYDIITMDFKSLENSVVSESID